MQISKKLQEKKLYRLGYTVLIALVGLYTFGSLFGIEKASFVHMAAVLLFSIVFSGFGFFESRGKILFGLVCIGVFTVLFLIFGPNERADFLNLWFHWIISADSYHEEHVVYYQVINCAGITAGAFLYQIVSENRFRVRGITGILLLFYLVGSMIFKRNIQHTGVVLGILLLLFLYMEWSIHKSKEGKGRKDRITVLWLIPFMVLYLVIMLVTPVPQKPYDWKFAKNIYGNVREIAIKISQELQSLKGADGFDIAFAGFSEDGGLASGLLENNEEVMQIETLGTIKTNIYLTGKIFDEFDGKKWIQTDDSKDNDRTIDTIETLYAVRRYDYSGEGDYVFQTGLKMKYQYFNSGYLFAPLKCWKLFSNDQNFKFSHTGGSLIFNNKKGFGTEYQLQYLQMNLDHPGFYQMLEEQQSYEYGKPGTENEENRQLLYGLQVNYLSNKSKDQFITEEILKDREERIVEIYGKPVKLSDELQLYVNDITEGAETDVEKLKAIENALRHMTYNVSPGKIPAGADFLDYFLLNKKEGFCSHYATAFVLLSRAEGIPARYVQGFCVPADGKKSQTVSVYSKMAHAWPEVYFEGVGWIPFEPTPGYDVMRYTPWEMIRPGQQKYGNIHYQIDMNAGKEHAAEALEEVKEEQKDNSNTGLILLYTAAFITGAGILLFLTDGLLTKLKYDKMSPYEKLRTQVMLSLNILSLLGYTRGEGETLNELRERTETGEKKTKSRLHFIVIYEEVRYGTLPVTDQLMNEIESNKKQLLIILKQLKGKKYFYYRIKLYFMKNKKN